MPQKLVVLGFDGLDPDLTERWMRNGRLPHLAALAAKGGLHRLETTPAIETLPVWASVATGVTPGTHGVFGNTAPHPITYEPVPSVLTYAPARYLFGLVPITAGRYATTRGGTSFWVAAGQAGVRASVIGVPGTFPPETVPNGELLSGLPLPDLRGTAGTYAYFASDVRPEDEGPTMYGGVRTRLSFGANVARAGIAGPPDPRHPGRNLAAPVVVTWNREARTANIEVAGASAHLVEHRWTKWLPVEFRVNAWARMRGLVQVYLLSAGAELRLYVSPVNWHPAHPPAPMSWPPSFASDLFERLGPFGTLGWTASAGALADGLLDEDPVLDDLARAFDDRAATLLHRIDAQRWDLFVGAVETIDTVQHLMWRLVDPGHPAYDPGLAPRYGNVIDRAYRKVDDLVGQIVARLAPDTVVLVVSGYGVHPFRWAVDLNGWLRAEGHLILGDGATGGPGWGQVDWARTRAYASGPGQIHVNLRGREGQGIVAPGAEQAAIVRAIADGLAALQHPGTGRRIVRRVSTREELYTGPRVSAAPDLQVSFEEGYRAAWPSAPGSGAAPVVSPNTGRWSGDHTSADPLITPGVLISSVAPTSAVRRLIDIAPTVLKYFGVALPKGMDGAPLF